MHFLPIISVLIGAALAAPGRINHASGRDAVPGFAQDTAELHPASAPNQLHARAPREPSWPNQMGVGAPPPLQPDRPEPLGDMTFRISNIEFAKPIPSTEILVRLFLQFREGIWTGLICTGDVPREELMPAELMVPCSHRDLGVFFYDFDPTEKYYQSIDVMYRDRAAGNVYGSPGRLPQYTCKQPRGVERQYCRQSRPVDREFTIAPPHHGLP